VRHRPIHLLLLLALALVASTAGCGDGASDRAAEPAAGPRKVVATTTVVGDFVKVVGGDLVSLTTLLRPNIDPHDYEPSPADAVALARADVIVSSGAGIDAWLDPLIVSAEPTAGVTVASKGVTLRPGDPHIWHDPRNAKIMVANIASALGRADPAHAANYVANSRAYSTQLDALDAEIATQIGTVRNPRLVTNHDALGYYVDRYGLIYVGSIIPSFDSSAELSAAEVATLVEAIQFEGVPAIFTEAALPPRTAEAIGREAGVKVVSGAGGLYGDGLGPTGSGADTYLTMMRHNTATIVRNLS